MSKIHFDILKFYSLNLFVKITQFIFLSNLCGQWNLINVLCVMCFKWLHNIFNINYKVYTKIMQKRLLIGVSRCYSKVLSLVSLYEIKLLCLICFIQLWLIAVFIPLPNLAWVTHTVLYLSLFYSHFDSRYTLETNLFARQLGENIIR